MGSPCWFTRQRVLKMAYFYWLRVKNSNHVLTELILGHLEYGKFYLESKASFIDISLIASFKLFLIAWLREYCTFSDSSVVSLKSSPWPKYTQLQLSSKRKNHVPLSDRQTDRHFYLVIKLRVVPSGAKSNLLSTGALSTKLHYLHGKYFIKGTTTSI